MLLRPSARRPRNIKCPKCGGNLEILYDSPCILVDVRCPNCHKVFTVQYPGRYGTMKGLKADLIL